MNIQRVRQIIEAYGAEPARWPAAERDQALAMVERTPELTRLREEAGHLDAALDAFAPAIAPPALRDRILARTAGTSQRSPSALDRFLQWLLAGTPRERILRPVMASLLPLLVGFALGAFSPANGADEVLVQNALADDVAALAFVDTNTLELGP